jgi:ubiquinone/menaquinone biosynthesis C-methylase UbiE
VVDVGAGTGIFARAWSEWHGVSVVAVEPAAAMAAVATRPHPEVRFVRGVAEHLPLRDGLIDVVWVSTALHHFADADGAVGEFARVLQPRGRVLVRTYVPGRTDVTYLEEFPGRAKWARPFHDEEQLRELFGRMGFGLVHAEEVLEWTETYAASADWVAMMRHADSMFTALSDDEVAAGLSALRSDPGRVGRLELTLLVFAQS